jgi:glutathione S-transferase
VSERPTLRMERTFAAPAERVFDAFTTEEVIRRWWQAGSGWDTPEATVDLRVGGEIRVVMHDPHKDARYGGGGRYTEIERPTRLAFTWIWDDDRDQVEQMIEIDFEERDGVTTMRFTHRNLWDEEAVDDHEDGWSKVFDNLRREIEA